MATRLSSGFHKAATKRIVTNLDTLPFIKALAPLAPPVANEPKPREAATANQARAAKAEAPLMPRGLAVDVKALAKAALAGLAIPFAFVVLRSLIF